LFVTIVYPSFAPPVFLDLLSPSNAAFGRNGDAPLEPRYEIRALISGHVWMIDKSIFVGVIGSEQWAKIYAVALSCGGSLLRSATNASCSNAHSVKQRIARLIAARPQRIWRYPQNRDQRNLKSPILSISDGNQSNEIASSIRKGRAAVAEQKSDHD
jgi:hypothetical protein